MAQNINRREELQARKDGAKLVKNSGRGMNKGDATIGDYMIDYKFTEAASYSLNLKKFHALEKQAWREGKTAITVAVFDANRGKSGAIVDWETLKELIDD